MLMKHSILAMALCALPSINAFANCAPHFETPSTYPATTSITTFAAADFNRDGVIDFVVGGKSLVILYGNGYGGFSAPVTIAPNRTIAVTTGDFDGDGDPDLAVSQSDDSPFFVIYRNDGMSFTKTQSLPTMGSALRMAAADFDGDGNLDVAYSRSADTELVFHGKGDGTFTQTSLTYTDMLYGSALAVGDLDGDGRADLVTALYPRNDENGKIVVFFGKASGFGAPAVYKVGDDVDNVIIADANGDGTPDIAAKLENPAGLAWIMSPGAASGGTLTIQPATYNTGKGIALADFNGDGLNDLVQGWPGHLTLSKGHGALAFDAPSGFFAPRLVDGQFLVIDANKDGKRDIAALTATGVAMLLGDGKGSFDSLSFAGNLGAADFNRDGHIDLLNYTPSGITTNLGTQSGRFTPLAESSSSTIDNLPDTPTVWIGNFNGDHVPDYATWDGRSIRISAGKGDGTFEAPVTAFTYVNPGGGFAHVARGDFNGDGIIDFVVGNSEKFTLVLNHPSGSPTISDLNSPPPAFTYTLSAEDMSGDGRADLLINDTIAISNGDGTFASPKTMNIDHATVYSLGDMNGDGITDIIIPGADGAAGFIYSTRIAIGHGDGTFTLGPWKHFDPPLDTYYSDGRVVLLGTSDVDGDGALDYVQATPPYGVVLLGDGKGGFGDQVIFSISDERPLALADFNNDGRADLLDGGFVRLSLCAHRRAAH
jgi:hypothetical protein